jgi:hypothetical protein
LAMPLSSAMLPFIRDGPYWNQRSPAGVGLFFP